MKAKKNALSIIWWLVGYVTLAIVLYFGLRGLLASHTFVDWISVFGVYTTAYSLVLMFVQHACPQLLVDTHAIE